MIIVCAPCWAHYGDRAPCDEGKPMNSPHRKGIPLPQPGQYKVCEEGAVCVACGCWPHDGDCPGRFDRNFMGSDGVIRNRPEHVKYLRRCAERWRQEGGSFGSRSTWREECEEHAKKIEQQADKIAAGLPDE